MKCERCKYFKMMMKAPSQCRKKAPVVLQEGGQDGYWAAHCWPQVKPDDFCGDFAVKPERKFDWLKDDAA